MNPEKTLAWIGPFLVFIVWLACDRFLPIANPGKELLRDAVLIAALFVFSRRVIPTSAPRWPVSIAVGLGVFVLWIAPDALFPAWRSHWLFQNAIAGRIKTSIPPAELTTLMLVLRTARAAVLVPIIEELFWRGWLVRWLQDARFDRVPIGRFTPMAFWATTLLFAAEHGPFWEVGLIAGAIYNLWIRKSKSLGDAIIAHATTNLSLSVYVIVRGNWSYWM